jgi:Rod binding domain-containing protein
MASASPLQTVVDLSHKADKALRQVQLRKTAGQLVAQTFFGTMMRQMRQSPWKSDLFGGGRGGEAYQQLLDQRLVEGMAQGVGARLVESLVKQWTRPEVERPTPSPAAQSLPLQQQNKPNAQQLQKQLKKNTHPVHRYGPTAITA